MTYDELATARNAEKEQRERLIREYFIRTELAIAKAYLAGKEYLDVINAPFPYPTTRYILTTKWWQWAKRRKYNRLAKEALAKHGGEL